MECAKQDWFTGPPGTLDTMLVCGRYRLDRSRAWLSWQNSTGRSSASGTGGRAVGVVGARGGRPGRAMVARAATTRASPAARRHGPRGRICLSRQPSGDVGAARGFVGWQPGGGVPVGLGPVGCGAHSKFGRSSANASQPLSRSSRPVQQATGWHKWVTAAFHHMS
jgi:hypothetical protein